MAAFPCVAIIYNPNSTGDASENARKLQTELRTAWPDMSIDLLPTEHAGHATELAYTYARQHVTPLIVSASGDGGYNEVINGALRAQTAGARPVCAVLPSGNANDHARTMQRQPLGTLIRQEKMMALDVLKVVIKPSTRKTIERYAHSYVGIGLTPTVAVELNKHTLNSLKLAWIVTKTFWNLHPVNITVNGADTAIHSLICSTIPEMAKVLTIDDTAKPRDGLFEVTTFAYGAKIVLLARLLRGVFKSMGAQRRVSSYCFTARLETPMQLDGEVVQVPAGAEVTVSVCPRLLHAVADYS